MRFLADENCDARVIRALREAGHDVIAIAEQLSGADDIDVLALSVHDQRILITQDLDFCEMVFRDEIAAYSIILDRIPSAQRALKAQRIINIVESYGEGLLGMMVSLAADAVRLRPLPQ